MLKHALIFCTLLFAGSYANAQNEFHLTIKLDSSINPQSVNYYYYDGKENIVLPDTFGLSRTIVFNERYYSPMASFHVSYNESPEHYYLNDFFITDKPSEISFYRIVNKDHKLHFRYKKNATQIFDTVGNKIWAGLNRFLADPGTNKDIKAFDEFAANNKDFRQNDSLTKVFHSLYKKYLNTAMRYLKQHPNEYFSFWYFINQLAQPNGLLTKDTAYLEEQLSYAKSVFPAKYINSVEGKNLINKYHSAIKPLKQHDTAPPFTLSTIDSTQISLKNLKGKNVLLVFWATWCVPCMGEIPFIKNVRKEYPPADLEIIGLSADIDLKPLKAVVAKHELNWPQYFDRQKYMSNLYSVNAYPTMILIDRSGKVIYRTGNAVSDEKALPGILKTLK